MSAAVIVTLVGLGVFILALAGYLAVIAWMLARINSTLGTVLARVRALAGNPELADATLVGVHHDLETLVDTLGGAGPGRGAGQR